VRPIARGAMGAIWRLSSDAGDFAVKQPFWGFLPESAVASEVAFRAACADVRVPSPAPIAAMNGEYVVHHEGSSFRLYEWVDGEVPDRGDAVVTAWLAAQMGAIHALEWSGPAGDEPDAFYHRVDVDWPALAAAADRAAVGWASDLGEMVPRLQHLSELVNGVPIGTMVWSHRDLKNTNVLRGATDSWLVDWDNAGPMAPWRELGALLMNHLASEASLRRITGAYRSAGGTAVIDGPTGFATGLAISLNFLHGQASSVLDATTEDHHRQFAAAQVAALLTSIPDLALLEQASRFT
jgi:phosphotransferase family enzyme